MFEREIKTVKDTTLWRCLKKKALNEEQRESNALAYNVEKICDNAIKRIKGMSEIHSQFTLHDEVHMLNVTEIMSKLISEDVLQGLNDAELFLLIVSAFFHDQGMVLDSDRRDDIVKSDAYTQFKENWKLDYPNMVEIQEKISDNRYSKEEKDKYYKLHAELDKAMLSEYIRSNHGGEVSKYIKETFSDNELWEVNGVNVANDVALLCKSHSQDISQITEKNGFRIDERIGIHSVNMKFLAILLRLADILDFDGDRTPSVLYKTIHFTSNVSIEEWEKHKSVKGWNISEQCIQYTVKCAHPIYQRVTLQFMDWIDYELAGSHELINEFASKGKEYKLHVPIKVDRSRIGPKDNSYVYHDLEFSLSRDELVRLLMMDNLYSSSALCVRELLQNSLDALRYRQSVFELDEKMKWTIGKVEFKHTLDRDDREVLICEDNGIGMDEDIVVKFLTNVGRSYYKSPEFGRIQKSLKDKGIDFTPCSQFGIGFMSCFMLGDEIKIETRKYYGGEKGKGKPLNISINGLNGLIVIKKGDDSQCVGTKITIICRNKPEYLDDYNDRVKLIDTLKNYALASEFPIEAVCEVEEIKGSIKLPAEIVTPLTFMEESNIDKNYYKIFKQDLSEVNSNISGCMKVSLIIDEEEQYTLENEKVKWVQSKRGIWQLVSNEDKSILSYGERRGKICCDGILVYGELGRDKSTSTIGDHSHSKIISIGDETLVMDIRGEIKPDLSPARIPKQYENNIDISWLRIRKYIGEVEGKLWGKILEQIEGIDGVKLYLKLVMFYGVSLSNISSNLVWDKLYIPLQKEDKEEWVKISTLNRIKILSDGKLYEINHKGIIKPKENISGYSRTLGDEIYSTLLGVTSLSVLNDEVVFKVEEPEEIDQSINKYCIEYNSYRVRGIPYKGKIKGYFMVQMPFVNTNINICVNMNHDLIKYVIDQYYKKREDNLIEFGMNMITLVSCNENLNTIIISRQMYKVGCLYKAVSWSQYDKKFKPPYKILTKENIEINITEEELLKWSEKNMLNFNV